MREFIAILFFLNFFHVHSLFIDRFNVKNSLPFQKRYIHEESIGYDSALKSTNNDECIAFAGILNITYDGSRFHGWSAANDKPSYSKINIHKNSSSHTNQTYETRKSRRNKRGITIPTFKGGKIPQIRSVEGVIQTNLAKLYGNVDPSQIKIEGCSRTDKGVHARSLIATFQCFDTKLQKNIDDNVQSLKEIPCNGDVGKIMFCLNRMLPPDVRIMGIYPLPKNHQFHPTIDALKKTYTYRFSIGTIHDPLKERYTWHLEGVMPSDFDQLFNRSTFKQYRTFDFEAAEAVTSIFLGTHHFTAFKGAFRGSERKTNKVINPICHIFHTSIQEVPYDYISLDTDHNIKSQSKIGGNDGGLRTYHIQITGDRFLYKMIRFMVGSIIAVGLGKITINDVAHALHDQEWKECTKKYIMCAPAHGLELTHVEYGTNLEIDWITTNI